MRNSRSTARDMLISLGVILVPCVLIYWFFARVPEAPQVAAADWKPVVTQARSQAPFTVLAPTNLPDTWKPIKALWGSDTLQLGFLAPADAEHTDGVYFEQKQTVGADQPQFVADTTRQGKADGTSTLGGRTWTRMVSKDGRTRCLVSVVEKTKPSTTVVCADVPYEAVEAFATTLA